MGRNEKKNTLNVDFQSMSNNMTKEDEILTLEKEIENERAVARRKSRIDVYYEKSLAVPVGQDISLPSDVAEAVRMKLYRASNRLSVLYRVVNENGRYKAVRLQ